MKRSIGAAAIALLALIPAVSQTADPARYCGQIPPGATPAVFAPGIVSTPGGHEFGIAFSPDGAAIIFGRRPTPDWSSAGLYLTNRSAGGWTAAKPFPVPGHQGFEPFITADGGIMYFSSMVNPEGKPTESSFLYALDRQAGGWSAPRYVGRGMSTSASGPGELYTTGDGFILVRAALSGGAISSVERLRGGMDEVRGRYGQVAHPAISPDGGCLLFDVDGERGFLSFPRADGTWGPAIDLASHGLPATAGIFSFSPDGKYIFYTSNGDIWWVSAGFIAGLRAAYGGR